MLPHFVLLYCTSILAVATQSRRFSARITRLLLAAVVLALTLFGGLRSDTVGADTIGYINRFEYLVSLQAVWDTYGSAEIGYKALLASARLISDNPTILLVLSSGVCATLYVTAIYRMAMVPPLALFVFISFGYFLFHMNGLRQGLALGIFMHALPSLLANRPLRFAAWIGVAWLFHSSAALVLLVYPIARMGFSVLSISILSLGAIIVTVSLDRVLGLLSVINDRLIIYQQRTEVGGTLLSLFHVLVTAVFVVGRPYVKREWRIEYEKLLLVFIFGTMILVIVQVTSSYVEMSRMALYFTVTMTFLWPILIRSITNPSFRLVLMAVFFLFGTFYYYTFLGQIGGYVPYAFR